MKLISEEEVKVASENYSCNRGSETGQIDFKAGVEFAETEYESILLELIESIFDYEKESGSKIIEFGREPETILEQFIIAKKSK